MLSRNEQISVLKIIGAVCRGATVPFPMNGTDYSLMFSCGAKHGFDSLLCRGLKSIFLPQGVLEQYNKKQAAFVRKKSDIGKAFSALDKGGYKYIPLDGLAVMGIYDDAFLRLGKDFNILVEEQQRESIRYYLEKNGFKHIRECKGCNFFTFGTSRFCILSLEKAYNGRIDLWARAVSVDGSETAHTVSPSDRYICALLKLDVRLCEGYGGVMQLVDILNLKLTLETRLDLEYVKTTTELLGLTELEAKVEGVYRSLFLGESDTDFDEAFLNDVFRDVPTKLPEKHISEERKKFFKKLKIITAVSAITAIVVAVVCILLIFGDGILKGDTSLPDFDDTSKTYSTVTEFETPFGYYSGQIDDYGLPAGNGTLSYYNGDIYVGAFSDGKRHGFGKTTFKSGGSYEGYYKDDMMCGQGKMIYANGNVTEGEFANDVPNGSCHVIYADGTEYIGNLKDGIRSGNGKFIYENGDVYEGEFDSGFRDGYGEYKYIGGAIYKGDWVSGVQNGNGTFTDADGTYTGTFEDGLFSGEGKYEYAGGDVYEGKWSNGKPHGSGKLSSKAGDVYEGNFSNGIINGSGQKTFANGDIAKGVFVNGKLSGNVDYYFKAYNYWRKALYADGKLVKYLDVK